MADEKLFPGLAAADQTAAPSNEAPAPETAKPAAAPDLFAQAPTTTATDGSGMVDSVISSQSTDAILGPKPKMGLSSFSGLSGSAGGSGLGALGGWVLKFAIVAGILTYAFFFTQLNPNFKLLGQNPVQKLATFEATLAEEQTTINLYNLLMAKFALDKFNVAADAYLLEWDRSQSEFASSNAREASTAALATLREPLVASLTEAKTRLAEPLYPPFDKLRVTSGDASILELEDQYALLLKQHILAEKPEGSAGVLQLLNNKFFRQDLKALNVENDLTPEKVQSLYTASTELSKDVFAAVLSIKNERPDWLKVLNALKETTRRVDPLYGSTIEGNLSYNNIVLDATDNTVSIRGQSRTDDSLNFSLLSNLIDAFEQSTLFSNVSNRTFSKNDAGSGEGVTSSFNLAFALQAGEDERDVAVPVVAVKPVPMEQPVAEEAAYGAAEGPAVAEAEETVEPEPVIEPEVEETPEAPSAFAPLSAFNTFISDLQTHLQAAILKASPKPSKTNARVKRVPRS